MCFTIPYPVSYGGVVDLFFKLGALQRAGVTIHLHCFGSNPGEEVRNALLAHCASLNFYPRKTGIRGLSPGLPYIVSSRASSALRNKLASDGHPILLEGAHCAFLLTDARFSHRKVYLRLHNVEHIYYHTLARRASSIFRKIYFFRESILLKRFERRISARASAIFTVSQEDLRLYGADFGCNQAGFVPVFTGFADPQIPAGRGAYCLYHGNLSVSENEAAVRWLVESVFKKTSIPLVVAGRNPSRALTRFISRFPSVSLTTNPSPEELDELIRGAQCHVVPSFNFTGVKLKLIHALYRGRHCLVNRAAVLGSGLESLCHVADTPSAFLVNVTSLFYQEITADAADRRRRVLNDLFDQEKNASAIIRRIW